LQETQPVAEAMLVRAEIQQIALAHRRRYGYRRITAELRWRGSCGKTICWPFSREPSW
jgi:hypothetical protein